MAEDEITAPNSESISDEDIRSRFSDHTYSVWKTPCALYLCEGEIYYFSNDVRYKDPLKFLEGDTVLEKVQTPKLKINFYPLSDLRVHVINKKFFLSREDFDKLSLESMFKSERHKYEKKNVKKLGEVQFADAIKEFRCEISCNTEYYLSHREEVKKDLKLDDVELKNDINLKQVEKDLLFKLLINIFGDEEDKKEEEKQTIILRDFHLVLDRNGFKIGTAERGDYYSAFFYNDS